MKRKIIILVILLIVSNILLGVKHKSVRINYHRFDGNYSGWGLHLWGNGYNGKNITWHSPMQPTGKNEYGIYWDIPYAGYGSINFIIHKGDEKDPAMDRTFPNPGKNKEIWTITEDPVEYTSLTEAKLNIKNKIISAILINEKSIKVNFRMKPEKPIKVRSKQKDVKIKKISEINQQSYKITTEEELYLNNPNHIICGSMKAQIRIPWQTMDKYFKYDGELGCFYKPEVTEFKLWAPIASEVFLNLFEPGNQLKPYKTLPMTRQAKGVWYIKITGDYLNQFYSYNVTNHGTTKEVLDPYAKSMAAFTGKQKVGKGAILNPASIGPKLSIGQIDNFEKREDAIIWEIHVRDFTSDPAIKTKAQFGTYKAFIEKLDYIKDLGVTHVQLLPVMSYYYGNELQNNIRELEYSAQNNNYNWGYDPHNYFSPEGMYSEKPANPQVRIAELKELIKEIHERNMGVILDCVYNHTAKISIFEDIVPNYYHFMNELGKPKSSYGGGRLGSTHAMTRKLILNSITYWIKEFKVDGFRFDLMGDLDAETVQMAYDQAKQLNKHILFIGEGWRTYAGDDNDRRIAADQDWMNQTDAAACFSDEMRNELKSGFGSEGEPRFITGGARNIRTIFNNLVAKPGNMKNDDVGDVVQYIAAHDNLTLHDVIAVSINKDPAITENEIEIQKRIRLGNALILTSQGIAFLHAGQEYGRTKQWKTTGKPEDKFHTAYGFKYPYFIYDSYDSSDMINKFDWDKVTQPGVHKSTRDYTKGLIELRKSTDAFRLGKRKLVDKNVKLISSKDINYHDLMIAYSCKSTSNETYYIFANCDNRVREIHTNIDLASKDVIVDAQTAGTKEISDYNGCEITNNTIKIESLTVIILKGD